MPAEGGDAVQVTRNGGFVVEESTDGRTLFYTKSDTTSEVWSMPMTGGDESRLFDGADNRMFAVASRGIYYIRKAAPPTSSTIGYFDLATGATRVLGTINKPLYWGLTVSPDGRRLIYTQTDSITSDLVLVEGFK